MSAHRVTYLLCDGCSEWWGLAIDCGSLYRQRREARADGWKTSRPGGKDYCSQECEDGPTPVLPAPPHTEET